MTGRTAKRIGMGLTVLAALGTELWFAFDGDASSEPWTYHLIQLPWWLLLPLAIGAGVWIPAHLIERKLHAEQLAKARAAAANTTQVIRVQYVPTEGVSNTRAAELLTVDPEPGESNTRTT